MKSPVVQGLTAIAIFALSALSGCTDGVGPDSSAVESPLTAEAVVAQDLTQLAKVGIPAITSDGVFSIGWKQFVGPAIIEAGTIGKAFAVVHDGTLPGDTRPAGIDIGSVTLTYGTGSTDLEKRVARSGSVLYSTFGRGLRHPETLPVNIPFIGGGTYRFEVSGSPAFPAGSFEITAPPSLLDITSQKDGDTFSPSSDLTVAWQGGAPGGDVLLRVVPHVRPERFEGAGPGGGPGGHKGPGPQGPGHQGGGKHGPGGLGPEFQKGLVLTVPNTGSYTISAAQLQELLNGVEAAELMVGVAQTVQQEVTHDSRTITLLLRNGDRVLLKIQQ
jgi:hypothetical protein